MKLIFNLDAYAEIPGTMVMLKVNFKHFVKNKFPSEYNKFIEEDFISVYTIQHVDSDYYYSRNINISRTRNDKTKINIQTSPHWLDFLGGEYIKL